MLEWRNWDDLLPARILTVPQASYEIRSLDSSPNGRWLVFENGDTLILLDWRSGEVISRHFANGYAASGLAFDPTSTFVAGLSYADAGGCLKLWRLDPAERFVPRPAREVWPSHTLVPRDEVYGNMALTLLHEDLDRTQIAWRERDLADTACSTTFNPDSRLVVFSLSSGYCECGMELVAYEVSTGKRRWCSRSEVRGVGPAVFTPDGCSLLVPIEGNEIALYRVEDGTLLQNLPLGLDEPVQALVFDHDSRTLWLATEEALVQYSGVMRE